MRRPRDWWIALLIASPLVGFTAAGAYALWETGRLGWLWWLLPVCWGGAYLLSRGRKPQAPGGPDVGAVPIYWTARDKEAWELVRRRAAEAGALPPARLAEPQLYWETAQSLAQEIAVYYHPDAKDPISSLTVPEILAAAELVLEDLAELVDAYVPGSRQLTVRRWRSLAKASQWYSAVSQASYLISTLFGPASAVSRFLVSRVVLAPALEMVQQNLLLWFYANFVQRVGVYAIEMNSRRLIGGAKRFRQELQRFESREPLGEMDAQEAARAKEASARRLTIGVVGQVKAGKSSLINAVLGERLAATDVLPATNSETRYELHDPELADKLVFVDTAGYSVDGPADAELEAAVRTFRTSDLVLVVLDAANPAREPDLRLLRRIDDWFVQNPQYKRPPALAVLTHIDLLSPRMEWSPPYERWREPSPKSPKEESIEQAVKYTREQLRNFAVDVVPVCCDADGGRIYGVDEWLFPEIAALLDEARAVLLVRGLHRDGAWERSLQTIRQIRNVGIELLRAAVDFSGSR